MINFSLLKSLVIPQGEVASITYGNSVLWSKPKDSILLNCYDVETEQLLQTIKMEVPEGGILYFNNDNAPTIEGYDFVVMDGVKHTGVVDGNKFNVWYVSQSVPDRTKTSWQSFYLNNKEITEILVNSYNGTSFNGFAYGCSSVKNIKRMNTSKATKLSSMFRTCPLLTTIPQIDTSNVDDMNYMLFACSKLTCIPPMDTSKVTNMTGMFRSCTSLTTIDWEIDMSSCTKVDLMFSGSGIKNVKFKNVPTSLDLSQIGTQNYTVVNYV